MGLEASAKTLDLKLFINWALHCFAGLQHLDETITSSSWFIDSISDCKKFKDLVDQIAEEQGKNEEKESEEVSSAAELVEKLKVTEEKKEEHVVKEETPAVDDKKDAKEWSACLLFHPILENKWVSFDSLCRQSSSSFHKFSLCFSLVNVCARRSGICAGHLVSSWVMDRHLRLCFLWTVWLGSVCMYNYSGVDTVWVVRNSWMVLHFQSFASHVLQ